MNVNYSKPIMRSHSFLSGTHASCAAISIFGYCSAQGGASLFIKDTESPTKRTKEFSTS